MLLQLGQPYRAPVLPFLDMVPDELFLQPGRLSSGHFDIPTYGVMMDGKPLPALAADNSLHQVIIRALHPGADARDHPVQVHQRGSRRGRPFPSRPRPLLRKPPPPPPLR